MCLQNHSWQYFSIFINYHGGLASSAFPLGFDFFIYWEHQDNSKVHIRISKVVGWQWKHKKSVWLWVIG